MNKPDWLKKQWRQTEEMARVEGLVREFGLNTVCREASCPNYCDCFNRGTATFMILGAHCTRSCGFCGVGHAAPPDPVDPDEATRVAGAVNRLGLEYVVITSVTRDDLEDGGAAAFAQTVREIRRLSPETKIETLIPDFGGNEAALDLVLEAAPDVISHNIETVRGLYNKVRPQADYDRSLRVLCYIAEHGAEGRTDRGVDAEHSADNGAYTEQGEENSTYAAYGADKSACSGHGVDNDIGLGTEHGGDKSAYAEHGASHKADNGTDAKSIAEGRTDSGENVIEEGTGHNADYGIEFGTVRGAGAKHTTDCHRLKSESDETSGEGKTVRAIKCKSGFMVGVGETDEQVRATIDDLREAGCAFLTIGQYLRPSPENIPVEAYIEPGVFDRWAAYAKGVGFEFVAAAPFVRSSYHAGEAFNDPV